MKRLLCIAALAILAPLNFAVAAPVPQQPAQQASPADKQAARDATREKLRKLLETVGPRKGVGVAFRQSTKQPYNFVGTLNTGLANCDNIEIVIGISTDETIGFRMYPYYKGGYVNLDKAKNGPGLARKMLNLSDHNFLFWGADDTGDVFAGYTFTLESGFPDRAIEIVLYSIAPLDKYVGEMRPLIDGTYPPAK